jgi:2-succinyl-5-enolpyruvyl-6-hydroxy-3-cyclohexene-1-carboxylate synthase
MHNVAFTLRALAALGVTEVAVAAGARNLALVKAVLEVPYLRVWSFFEERSMGFFALGRIMTTQRPVAVITTSGTAAVELAPAVVEAYYQGLPLIAVTADRPLDYRGSGAPQAIEQVNLYGRYAVCYDLPMQQVPVDSLQYERCPVQLNVCLDEPDAEELRAITPPNWEVKSASFLGPHCKTSSPEKVLDLVGVDLVLASGLHPVDAAYLSPRLAKLGAPILAEATANLTGVDHLLIQGGERALSQMQMRHVLRLGAVPSWRWWRDLEERDEVRVTHVSRVPLAGLARDRHCKIWPLEHEWSGRSEAALPPPLQLPCEAFPLAEPSWMRHLRQAMPQCAQVFLGNSLPIREWNLAVGCTAGITCWANRGTNGIDGLVSSYLGVSADFAESWLILGDLSALYDLAGPWIAEQLPAANRRIVVINNSGGKIFSRVKALRGLDARTHEVIENRHQRTFSAWAEMWGWQYRRVERMEDLQNLPDGHLMLEVVPDTEQTERFWAEIG